MRIWIFEILFYCLGGIGTNDASVWSEREKEKERRETYDIPVSPLMASWYKLDINAISSYPKRRV